MSIIDDPGEVDIKSILRRLWCLEAESAVRKVMASYMAGCDLPSGKGEAVAACFTADGIWEAKGLSEKELGSTQGTAALIKKFDRNVERLTFSAHHLTNERIWVDGETARGEWMFIEPAVYRDRQAVWLGGRYENDFCIEDGKWKMSISVAGRSMRRPMKMAGSRLATSHCHDP